MKFIDTTAHKYTLAEIKEAMRRLIRLGMRPDRALAVVRNAFPEHATSLSEVNNATH